MNLNNDVYNCRPEPEGAPSGLAELWKGFRGNGGGPRRAGPLWTALLEQYLWIAKDEARSFFAKIPRGAAEFDELFSEGVIGLADALSRFDVSAGTWFPAFARWRVRGRIADRLRALDPIPRSWRRLINEIEAARQTLRFQLKCEPSPSQLCEFLGIGLDDYHRSRRYLLLAVPASVEALTEPDEEAQDMRRASLPSALSVPAPDGQPPRPELLALVAGELRRLPLSQALVLSIRYVEELNRVETSVAMGLRVWQVRTLEMRALTTLRERLSSRLPGRL